MAKTFVIPLINPFRFVNSNPVIDPRYNDRPFDYQVDQYSYFQKWQTNDKAKIQVLSDYEDLSFDFYTCDGIFFRNIPIAPIDVPILGVTFKAYEAEVDFSLFPENVYYGVLSYTDEDEVIQYEQTSPIDVAVKHADTLLYEVKNTYNDKGVVFDTGIVINFRVEGLIREFTPSSDDEEYVDQTYNPTQLDSIPYRVFTNYIGLARGLPDWVIDKMNIIFSVNEIKINGIYYNKADGAKFDMVRPSQTIRQDGYTSIKIIQSDNFFLQKFKTGDLPTGDLIVIKKAWPPQPHDNFTGNFIVPGIFTDNSNLIRLALWNISLDEFDILIGTTLGGEEIAKFHIANQLTNSLDIGHVFNAATTVHVTMPDGVNTKIIFDYNQYDAPVLNDPDSSPGNFVKGTVYIYEEINAGDFELDWNVATGQGLRKYVGCVLSGTNGTKNRANKYSRGWDKTQPAQRGIASGASDNTIELTVSQLPENIINFNRDTKGGHGGYDVLSTSNVTGLFPVNVGGAGDPIDVSPDSWNDVYFVKITD